MAKSKAVLSELADEILAAATAEVTSSKTAAVTGGPVTTSDVAAQFSKLAAAVRSSSQDVTYDDVREFRKRYGI